MPAKKKSKKVITSAAAAKAVETAMDSLSDVASTSAKAIDVISKEKKKLLSEAKRLSKKRAVLTKKKKTAATKVKKEASAANKKVLKTIEKEIMAIRKTAAKVASRKTVVADELAKLKAVSKRATAYTSALGKTDTILNKPKKKRRKKKAVKKA